MTLPVSCTPARPLPMRKSAVRDERVLRVPPAHADRARIALADLDVDVAHRRVERAGAGVARRARAASARAGPPRPAPGRLPEKNTMYFG